MKLYIQENINKKDIEDIENICNELNISVVKFFHIPFSNEYPQLDFSDPFFVYAASEVTDKIFEDHKQFAGVFSHTKDISIKNFFNNTPELMWSESVIFSSLQNIKYMNEDNNKKFFIRPVIDNKWFSGHTLTFFEIKQWILKLEKIDFDLNTEIVLAEVSYPQDEYRLFVVDYQVCCASLYRQNMTLNTSPTSNQRIINFANTFIEKNKHNLPNSFVIDVADSTNKIGVIEINGINNSGFYDIDKSILFQQLKNKLKLTSLP